MRIGPERVREHEKRIYVIRDVWRAYGENGRKILARCEYAVMEGDTRVWKTCAEGVLFSEIEPFVTIDG